MEYGNITDKKIYLEACMSQNGIRLSEKQAEQFLDYFALLTEWNQKINLTAITGYQEIVLKHFVDSSSLTVIYPLKQGENVIDVGTGAGFPGIPLKIIRPDLRITLLDSLGKRVHFLETVIDALSLDDAPNSICAVHGRAEEAAHMTDHRGKYDLAVSRAVSNLSVLSEYCVPFLKVGGILAAYKSDGQVEEAAVYQQGIEKLGASVDKIESLTLSDEKETIHRKFVLIRKNIETPQQYPRKAGIPTKRPLK